MSKHNKSSFAEYDARVNKIYELLICGYRYYDILQYVSNKTNWEVDDRQVSNYIAEAKELIKEYGKQTREEFIEDAKNKLKDLYLKNMSMKNTTECRRIIETANKVLGYEKLNINMDANINQTTELRIIGIDANSTCSEQNT